MSIIPLTFIPLTSSCSQTGGKHNATPLWKLWPPPKSGVATARGHRLGQTGAALEFRVADRAANRVGIRIAATYDKNFAPVGFNLAGRFFAPLDHRCR